MGGERIISWASTLSASDLAPDAKESLPIPDGAPMVLNAYSMIAFAPIFDAIFSLLPPENITEIGVDLATMSPFLLDRVRQRSSGGKLHCVDAAFKEAALAAIAGMAGEHGDVIPHGMLSSDFLRTSVAADCNYFVIDGDHNYETVSEELSLIDSVRAGRATIAFMHDVGWPCGRRDMYYVPERISSRRPAAAGHLSPFSMELGDSGLDYRIPVALSSGGERNGVQTAIDDFIAGSSGKWCYFSVPLFYGLGVLWSPAAVSSVVDSGIRAIQGAIDLLRPMLGYAEANRIALLMRVQEGGKAWQAQQSEIRRLREAIQRDRAGKRAGR